MGKVDPVIRGLRHIMKSITKPVVDMVGKVDPVIRGLRRFQVFFSL